MHTLIIYFSICYPLFFFLLFLLIWGLWAVKDWSWPPIQLCSIRSLLIVIYCYLQSGLAELFTQGGEHGSVRGTGLGQGMGRRGGYPERNGLLKGWGNLFQLLLSQGRQEKWQRHALLNLRKGRGSAGWHLCPGCWTTCTVHLIPALSSCNPRLEQPTHSLILYDSTNHILTSLLAIYFLSAFHLNGITG